MNILFLFGNDEFAITRKIKEFEAEFNDATIAGLNIAHFEGRTASDEEFNNALNAMPFLAPKRLVTLGNPSAKYAQLPTRKKFEEYLKKTPDTVKLVLHEIIEPKEASRHWLVKWAEKNSNLAKSQAFMLPSQKEMPGWIINETKKQGGKIDAAAAVRLAEMVGVETRQAGMEISKLLAYVNWSKPIQTQDVETVCVLTSQQNIFDFVDALSLGNGKASQKYLHRLLENNEEFAIWAMVVRQFRLLIQAREILDGRGNLDDVTRTLGLHPFAAGKLTNQAANFRINSLERIYHQLLEIDEQAKTGQITLSLALDNLIVALAK